MVPNFRKLLVPTDFSPTSTRAVDYARALAGRLGARVHLLHVIEDPFITGTWSEMYAVGFPEIREQLTRDAELRLAALRTTFAGVPTTSEVRLGSPAATIAEAAHQGADMIVMGTHGRSGFAHLMLGSVAERVLRLAPCPVLTIRDGVVEAPVEVKVGAEVAPTLA
jgi:nucleotide-binding universal stress UspA family protein